MYILCTEEPGSARPRLGAGRPWPRPRAAAVVYFGPSSLPRHQGGRTRRELRRAATQTHTTPHSVDMLLCTAVYTLYLRIFSRQYELIMHQESGWRFFSDHGALEQKLI